MEKPRHAGSYSGCEVSTPTRRAVSGPRASVLAGLYRPRALTRWGSGRTGTCVVGTPGTVRTCKPFRVRDLESRAFPGFATGAGSPCLLVKGADCAGVCLAVLAWLCPGLSRDARSRVARIKLFPALTGAGDGVASGATKLVPATLSGLAQRGEQCPSLIGKPWGFFTIRLGRPLWLPLRLVLRTKRCALP